MSQARAEGINDAIDILEAKYHFKANAEAEAKAKRKGNLTEIATATQKEAAAKNLYDSLHELQNNFDRSGLNTSGIQEEIYDLVDGITNHEGVLVKKSPTAPIESTPLIGNEQKEPINEVLLREKFTGFLEILKTKGAGERITNALKAVWNALKIFCKKVLPFGCGVGSAANVAAGVGYAAATGVAIPPLSGLAATGAITGGVVMSGYFLFKSYQKHKTAQKELQDNLNKTRNGLENYNTVLRKP